MFLGEIVINVLDQRIEAEVCPVKLARHGDVNARIRGARGGHTRVPEKPVRQHLVHPARVGDIVVEIKF